MADRDVAGVVADDLVVRVRADGRLVCATCAAPYHPALTAGGCPVCGTPAPGVVPAGRSSPDTTVLIVAIATVVNIVLLALLAIVVLHR